MRFFNWCKHPSAFGDCPLCSQGEAGGEHLGIWCPAVASTWETRRHPDTKCNILTALGGTGRDAAEAIAILHQAVFLTGSMLGRAAMTWKESAKWITAAIQFNGLPSLNQPVDLKEGDRNLGNGLDSEPGGDMHSDKIAVWSQVADTACYHCTQACAADCLAQSGKRSKQPSPDGRPALPRLPAVARVLIQAEQVIAVLITDQTRAARAAWPLAGKHWWPIPGRSGTTTPNARWACHTCPSCKHTTAHLIATRKIRTSGEITVANNGHILGSNERGPPHQISFDEQRRPLEQGSHRHGVAPGRFGHP
jgi:hypothetical protein